MKAIEQMLDGMSLWRVINERRSVREFRPNVLARNTIEHLIQAGIRAPTAMHQQPWGFVVVQDKAALRRISDLAKPIFREQMHSLHRRREQPDPFADPEFNIFYDAPALIVVCGLADAPFVAADCWLAAENIMLAAYAQGLGSCVIGSAASALNLPEVKRELQISEAYTAVAPIIVGLPARTEQPSSRNAPVILHWA